MSSEDSHAHSFPSNFLKWLRSWRSNTIVQLNPSPAQNESLTRQIEARTRDNMLKEINDWLELIERDSYLAPLHPVRDTAFLNERDSKHLYNLETIDDERLSIYCIAVHLLASCYTDLQCQITNLPGSLYISKTRPNFISSLRMHAQYRFSPCSGYHPRDSSPVSEWPIINTSPSPEERLLERLTQRREDVVRGRIETMQECISLNNNKARPSNLARYLPLRQSAQVDSVRTHRCCSAEQTQLSTDDELEEEPLLVSHFGSSQIMASPKFWFRQIRSRHDCNDDEPRGCDEDYSETRNSTIAVGRSKVGDLFYQKSGHSEDMVIVPCPLLKKRDQHRKWSLQPVIRLEPHPLFVQPIKGYETRRQRHRSGTRASRAELEASHHGVY
jgi:hypothetical protein